MYYVYGNPFSIRTTLSLVENGRKKAKMDGSSLDLLCTVKTKKVHQQLN